MAAAAVPLPSSVPRHLAERKSTRSSALGWSDILSFKMDTRHVTPNFLRPLCQNINI